MAGHLGEQPVSAPHRPAPVGIIYTVEGGSDLATWSDAGIVLHGDVQN